MDSAKKSGTTKVATDAIKTASKKAIHKTAEAMGDLTGNKIADKITNVSNTTYKNKVENIKLKRIPKERYIPPEKRQQITDELGLVNYINKMEYQKIINLVRYPD